MGEHTEFRLPDIGEGVHEGEVVRWYVEVGERVEEDAPMVEVMTDKATVTIDAPRAARVVELRVAVGDVAKVGEVLLVLDEAGAEGAPTTPKKQSAATAVGDIREGLPGASYFGQRAAEEASAPPPEERFAEKPLATPATRKLARERGVDLRRVAPTGPGGRVTREDVLGAAVRSGAPGEPPGAPSGPSGVPPDVRRPFVGMRRKIAERLQRSVRTAAHFTFVEEVDADRLVALRETLAPEAEARGLHLTYLPFAVRAVALALSRHPALNAYLDEAKGEIVERGQRHIGVATATDAGLVVPVVRDADALRLLDLGLVIERLGSAARAGTLRPAELSGSTFTVTSLGKRSGLLATPVLNYPEVGILGLHRIKRRPVVRGDAIVIGHVMNLSLSFDHRLIDGHVGAEFAYEVIDLLEAPERLLL